MKKALMYASVASMIQQFNMENIKILLDLGYKVDVACNMEQGSSISAEKIDAMKQELEQLGVECIHVPVPRSIVAFSKIIKSLRVTRKIMNDRRYDIVHCHSPIGGMICRLANRLSFQYKRTRLIYTAHGFHFFEGAPLKNWVMFYPVEKICARFTDVLITINQEDYSLAQKKMKTKEVVYIPGVGIDLNKFRNVTLDKEAKRCELGVPAGAVMLLSVGELNRNKNHETVIRAVAQIPNVYYIIAGKGGLQNHLQQVIEELGLSNRVKLLGFRDDVGKLMKSADVFVMPSFREGLSVALMEAMACGLPCVASKIRGNTDLIDSNGGSLFNPGSINECTKAIKEVLSANAVALGGNNNEKINMFSSITVNEKMRFLYKG